MNDADVMAAFKRVSKSKAAADAAGAVLAHTVLHAFLEERVKQVRDGVLADYPVYRSKGRQAGERLLDSGLLYMADECHFELQDSIAMGRIVAAGLKPAGMAEEFCPALVAEGTKRVAEKALIKLFAEPVGLDEAAMYGEKRAKFLDLCLKLMLAGPRRGSTAAAARLKLYVACKAYPDAVAPVVDLLPDALAAVR